MTYGIGKIGRRFLAIMGIKYNDHYFAPDTIFSRLSNEEDRNKFKDSVFNPNFYSRAATEIMGKIFTPAEQEKLKVLMAELAKKDNALAANASSEIKKIINK